MAARKLKRCSAKLGIGVCGSAIFYDWGIQLLDASGFLGIDGQVIERFKDFGTTNNVKICARCTTPYVIEGGELIDITDELSAEDVKLILSRGQAQLPHPKIKDP